MFHWIKKKIPEIGFSDIRYLSESKEATTEDEIWDILLAEDVAHTLNKYVNLRNTTFAYLSCFLRVKTKIVRFHMTKESLSTLIERLLSKTTKSAYLNRREQQYSQSIRCAGFVQVQRRHNNV